MNYRIICRTLSLVLGIEAALMFLPVAVALIYHENLTVWAITILATASLAGVLALFKPRKRAIYAREGFFSVAISWVLMSAFGALPFRISR